MEELKQAWLGKSIPVLDKGFVELQDLMGDDLAIVNAARVSFLGESKGTEKDKKLLFYLMRHRHTSPFEMVEFKWRVRAPLVVWWQWARHRMWCLAGNTQISFSHPNHTSKDPHPSASTNHEPQFTIKQLYKLWQNPAERSQIEQMPIRVYDENAQLFTVSHIADVMYSGNKRLFEIELADGQLLQCSKDHRILTSTGWQRLEDAIGLRFNVDRVASMTQACYVATHQQALLQSEKSRKANSPSTSSFDGYSDAINSHHSSLQATWKSEPYGNNPAKPSPKEMPLSCHYSKVVSVRYIGIQDTYDLSIKGPHHNFVANGIVVHNSYNAQSGRYTPFEENDFYSPENWRWQAESNKQASDGDLDPENNEKLKALLLDHYEQSYKLYQQALEIGVAKEQARLFLPGFSVYYTWVCKVDAHNLMHFLSLRMADDAQWEIQQYAKALYEVFKHVLPWTAEAFETYRPKK